MNWFNKLPHSIRSAPGLEWSLWRKLPIILTVGTAVPLLALAAIARPEDFFSMLRAQGLTLTDCIALPDHFDFDSWKRPSSKHCSLICTEKDAIKLWRHHPDALAVPLQVHIDPGFFAALDALLPPARLSSVS